MAKPSILIVDDDREMCGELKLILEDEGYAVDAVYDGLQAVTRLDKGGYNLMLLDLKLPGITGYKVLELAKDRYPSIKVIVLTGKPLGNSEVIKEAEIRLTGEEGLLNSDILSLADSVFNKPYDVEGLLSRISEFVRPGKK